MEYDELEQEERQEIYNNNVIRKDEQFYIDQFGKIIKFKKEFKTIISSALENEDYETIQELKDILNNELK